MTVVRTCLTAWLMTAAALPLAADDEGKEARKLLDRAIAAMGGEKVLKKHPALTGKSRGTVMLMGKNSPVTNEWTVQGLSQLKWTSEVTLNERATTITITLGGGKAWIQANAGQAGPLPKDFTRPFEHGVAGLRVAESPVLLLEKGWKLSSLGEIKVDGKPAVGIKASRKGLPDIDLYFDKKTHLPVQSEMRLQEKAEEATYIGRFGDYKTFAGRKCFTKLTVLRNTERVLEMERSDIRPLERRDDATFDKP